MSSSWKRKLSLKVSNAAGNILDLSQFRIRFEIRQYDIQSPNNAQINVFNLKDETSQRLVQSEYTHLTLSAGYEHGDAGLLFEGDVRYFRRGRESTDTYLTLLAGDGDLAYSNAVINQPMGQGANSPKDQVDACLKVLEQFGVTRGFINGVPETQPERGGVLTGMVSDVLRVVCSGADLQWNINQGKLQIFPLSGFVDDGPITVLTSKTGLIGRPEQTLAGIHATCLINPNLHVGSRVKIDNASINQTLLPGGRPASGDLQPFDNYTSLEHFAEVATDGIYRLLVLNHRGDTRERDWYTDLIGLSLTDAVPIALAAKGVG